MILSVILRYIFQIHDMFINNAVDDGIPSPPSVPEAVLLLVVLGNPPETIVAEPLFLCALDIS